MSDGQKGYVMFGINVVVFMLIGILTWNANRICNTVDKHQTAIQQLKQQSVRWSIVAEDVKEIKGDMKILLRK